MVPQTKQTIKVYFAYLLLSFFLITLYEDVHIYDYDLLRFNLHYVHFHRMFWPFSTGS